jgi:quinoprotein glucose dehydrogenase
MFESQTRFTPTEKRLGPLCLAAAVVAAVGLSVSGQTPKQPVSGQTPKQAATKQTPKQAIPEVATTDREWRDFNGGPDSSKYKPLNQINRSNINRLDMAWNYPYAETNCNPIIAHGMIYVRGRNKSVIALDAATGKEIWIHDGMQGITERGFNYWESPDGNDRRLIFWVDYLQEIDARTGKSIRTFGNDGAVDLRLERRRNPDTIGGGSAMPGKIYDNLLIMGLASGEGRFAPPGDIRAYNVITGKMAWEFHVIPHPGEFGFDTWPSKDSWLFEGAANVWGEISVDAKRGIVYLPTGNTTEDFYGGDRLGNTLFSDCLLALDARTGKRLWHFQTVHHDLWDYDNVAAPMLTTITHNGKKVDVVALAGKTGYLYVFDRVTGEPIWPIPETPVPQGTKVPGEVLSLTQPIPTVPAPFTRMHISVADLDPYILTDAQRADFKKRLLEDVNGGPFQPIGFDEVIHMPGNNGGANWGMTSANPNDGTVYVGSQNCPSFMRLLRPEEERSGRGMFGPVAAPQAYVQTCQACHGADRTGVAPTPSLIGVTQRRTTEQIRSVIMDGSANMPANHSLTNAEVDQLMAFVTAPPRPIFGGRNAGPPPIFPPGPIVETGPVKVRPPRPADAVAMTDYPPGFPAPEHFYRVAGYGLEYAAIGPPWTTMTAYDLNKGAIKWQIGVGDDYRVVSKGGPAGTGSAITEKHGAVVTSGGLLFVAAADRWFHIYDTDTGKELRKFKLGATSDGTPATYEFNGRQYVLVTSSPVGSRMGAGGPWADPAPGPTGLIAYALKQ